MGNCFSFRSVDANRSAAPSTSGTPNPYANGGRYSGRSSSSASQSRYSFAASEDISLDGEILPTSNLKVFSFGDLKSATGSFRSATVLGVGGFGTVYKGFVDERTLAPTKFGSGMIVAIKKLNDESVQGFQEWQSEVNFLGRLCHPNLVKLLGYCWEDQELLLVYEFMQKGSLENHLFGRVSNIEPLSWDIRLKIAIDAAKGLAFLHSPDVKVIYRDFKASNILLDGNYNAKISDFGIAKTGPSGGDSHVTTRIIGTHGYAAPEYVATGHLYVKSDVYGFGVVLLEILTGLRALDMKRPKGQQNLIDWAKPLLPHKGKLSLLMDAHMEGQYSPKAALLAARLALRCLESEPKKRPSMKEVLEVLERVEAINGKTKAWSKAASATRSTSHPPPPPPHHHHNHHHGHGHEHGNRNGNRSSDHRSPLHPSHKHGAGKQPDLARLCHPNLVKLLGYCWEDQELLLVYEFMQKGRLENHLFGRVSNIESLSWDIRLKIAIGAAKGLAFLHSPDVKVIYRDFKASNILLDGNYNAKISDFGIAKVGPSGGDSHVTTRIIGTHGYAAPEYVATGHLYVKSDVYGFGVVLLEILTGLRALDMKWPKVKQNLIDWAKPLLPHKGKLLILMDGHIEGQYSPKAAFVAAQLTLRCLESEPKKRPSMKEVVEVLERVEAINGKTKAWSKAASATRSTSHPPPPPPHHNHHHGHGRKHGNGNGNQSSDHRSPLHPSQKHGAGKQPDLAR